MASRHLGDGLSFHHLLDVCLVMIGIIMSGETAGEIQLIWCNRELYDAHTILHVAISHESHNTILNVRFSGTFKLFLPEWDERTWTYCIIFLGAWCLRRWPNRRLCKIDGISISQWELYSFLCEIYNKDQAWYAKTEDCSYRFEISKTYHIVVLYIIFIF